MELAEISLKKVQDENFTTTIIPIGSREVRGIDLPYGSDTIIGRDTMARHIADFLQNAAQSGVSWTTGRPERTATPPTARAQ